RPAATVAALPALSAAALSLQYLALLSAQEGVPHMLPSVFGSLAWLAPSSQGAALAQAFLFMVLLAAFHALAVLRHLRDNGNGSADALPHSLSFGSWELRGLSFVALPMSAAAASLVISGWRSGLSLYGFLLMAFGAAQLGALLAVGFGILHQLQQWFDEALVICIEQPFTGHLKYMDRVCDQLCAIPVQGGGHSRLLADWTRSAGWQFSPAVATIHEIEHRGPVRDRRRGGHWAALWPSDGPWVGKRDLASFAEFAGSSSAVVRENSKGSLRSRSGVQLKSRDRGDSMDQGLITPRSKEPSWPQSAVLTAHPVRAATKFAYAAGGSVGRIAGVAGVSWLDAAVPAAELRRLEAQLGGEVELRAQVSQLAGPLTSGRFSACFDMGDRRPWRWPFDLILRVALGALVVWVPALGPSASHWSSWSSLRPVFHFVVIGALAVLVIAVLSARPHVHMLDNLAATTSVASILLGTLLFMEPMAMEAEMPGVSPDVAILVVVSFIPACLALAAAVLAASYALSWRRDETSDEKVMAHAVPGWSEAAVAQPSRFGASGGAPYSLAADGEDESPSSSRPLWSEPNTAVSTSSAVRAVLLPAARHLGWDSGQAAKRVKLLAQVCQPVSHLRVWTKGPSAVSSPGPEELGSSPEVAMPAGILFALKGLQRQLDLCGECPMAAVLTPVDGLLLFADPGFNGGVAWHEALRRFLGDEHPALTREAERVLRDHEALQSHLDPQDRPLAVLEVQFGH
ncbi:unnamed protein product, partial [Polarella glacialis]